MNIINKLPNGKMEATEIWPRIPIKLPIPNLQKLLQTTDNSRNIYRNRLERLLDGSGITFNGDYPWDIRVYHPDLYERILTQGVLGLGEAYMDGWWDTDRLDEFFAKLFSADIKSRVKLDP
jgi:hypothetical protein